MRTIAMMVFMAASAGAQEPRFFARDVDFWGRPQKTAPVNLWRGEGSPPEGPARDLLERPTPENARRYLEWQQARLDQLHKALQALEAAAPPPAADASILLFSREDCPYSKLQEEVVKGLPVTILRPGQSPELWTLHDVKATPTLVIRGRKLVGLKDRATLEQLLREGGTR